jgi:DNA repair protein RecO (recombination protein O)
MAMSERSRVYRAEAVVLRRLNLGETDRILTLFTRELGKLRAVAKGARGAKSRLSGATEPFTAFDGLLAVGQNLDVLTQAEVREAFLGIRKDLVRIGYASHFLEIIDAGTEERQPSPGLWDLLVAGLTTLEIATSPDVLCRAFELQAMSVLGYEPQLHQCVLDEADLDPHHAFFHPTRGGALCPKCGHRTPGAVHLQPATLRALQDLSEQPFISAARAELPERVRGELARCMVQYVRHHLEAPLRSLHYLDDVTAPLHVPESYSNAE